MWLEQLMVKKFHKEFGFILNDVPTIPDRKDIVAGLKLINEEVEELEDNCLNYRNSTKPINIVKIADDLGDILYVTIGMAVRFGINMEPIFQKIQDANMRKVGGYKDENGKWRKPEGWVGPEKDIEEELVRQGWKK